MKVACAIIGSGNIGTDLFYKLSRSDRLEPVWMVGIEPASTGLARAAARGAKTTARRPRSAIDEIAADGVKIAFDATSASEHAKHAALLERAGILSIDLTPAAIGPYCVPSVNLASCIGEGVAERQPGDAAAARRRSRWWPR